MHKGDIFFKHLTYSLPYTLIMSFSILLIYLSPSIEYYSMLLLGFLWHYLSNKWPNRRSNLIFSIFM